MEASKDMGVNVSAVVDRYDTYDWYLDLGPLSNVDAKYFHGKIPTWNDFVNHPDYDAFWKRQGFAPWLNRVTVPTLNVAGWWDQEDFYGPLKIYELLERHDTARRRTSSSSGRGITADGRAARGAGWGASTSAAPRRIHYRQNILAPFFAHYLKDKGELAGQRSVDLQDGRERVG